ncbi:glycosyltransferase [Bacillus sp. V3-13]|uniref:WecB/TagA/CpsF family glycosyltransferase n=1 Tax=Bacillus sp. V3-13 TaxID=2053728 RepID=UPI000C787F46|nr:WecB/TagA/CpsF family glycosyltransferase [Bacillus sp. V3-13]PLR78260.1 glycosyltransferase [Bacillus sp. V3-13]
MEYVKILGTNFINTTLKDFTKVITQRIIENKKTFIVTANPEIVMHAEANSDYQMVLDQADFITADGIGIVKAAALLNRPLPERVAGFDLMIELLKVANNKNLRVYLLGAEETVLLKAVDHIHTNYPNVIIVGHHHGFFDWDDPSLAENMKQLNADLIFVALGFPKQENWIYQNINKFDKGIFMGVGGSFDVLSGNVKRAPLVWRKLNIEWLYRLLKQPSRWKRMLVLPKFIIKVLEKKISNE